MASSPGSSPHQVVRSTFGHPVQHTVLVECYLPWVALWRSGRVLDLRSRGRGFDSESGRNCITTVGKSLTPACLDADADSLRYYMESLNGYLNLYLYGEGVVKKVHGLQSWSLWWGATTSISQDYWGDIKGDWEFGGRKSPRS